MTGSYQLIDSGNFEKLEQVGTVTVSRPSPQAVWPKRLGTSVWSKVDAHFSRFSGGDGTWAVKNKKMPTSWLVKMGAITFKSTLTDFGHIGMFPEQFANWEQLKSICAHSRDAGLEEMKVLNLFAYTGGSTLAAAAGGAHVVHLDASKTSVAWARENAEASALDKHPIRWITDDVQAFVARELRRGSKYHGIILDPPSYGRGSKGETWKIEDHLNPLLKDLKSLLADNARFVLLSSHSAGFTPIVLQNLLASLSRSKEDRYEGAEMLLPERGRDTMPLPSGASCFLHFA